MNRWLVALLLLGLAVVLNQSLTFWGHDVVVTWSNGKVVRHIATDPVMVSSFSVADSFSCFGKPPCPRAWADMRGFYPRSGVLPALAQGLGIVLPTMLVTAAPLLLLFGLSRPWRIAAAVVLVGVGLLLSEPLFMFLYFWTQSRGPIGVWLSSPEVLLVVAGLTCFAGGSFLAFRAIFDRTT